jgi:hypothetical protein
LGDEGFIVVALKKVDKFMDNDVLDASWWLFD